MMNVVYTNSALGDIEEIVSNSENPEKILAELDKKKSILSMFPKHGQRVFIDALTMQYRYVQVVNLLLFYIVNESDDCVEIMRVFHARSNWMASLR